jgi:signal transduction histidine kinase/CheY-like chemotaxis protein
MKKYRILHLEDSETDSGLIKRVMEKGGLVFEYLLCDNENSFRSGIDLFKPDVILCDHNLPQFDSVGALKIFMELKLDIPFILVTGNVLEEYAVDMMKKGIDDYLLKSNLHRLIQAIENASGKREKERLRRLAEFKLEQNSFLLNRAQQMAHIGSWEVNLQTMESFWSDEAYRLLGLKPGDLVPSLEEYLAFIHPDDMGFVRQNIHQAGLEFRSMAYYNRIVRKNGVVRHIYCESSFEFNEQDVPVRFHGTMQDVTDKVLADGNKDFERKNLSALINNTSDLIWSVDRDFKLITSNQAFDEMMTKLLGKAIPKDSSVLAPGLDVDVLNRFKGFYERAFSGEVFTELESHADSWSEISFYPIRKDTLVIGTACYLRNITERKKAEQDILHKNEELKNLASHLQEVREEERATISREIHDELGQQLTALKMDIDWVLHKQVDTENEVAKKLNDMLKMSDHVIHTIRRISSDLRPAIIDDLGLIAALEWKCHDFEEKTGMPCYFVSKVTERKFENKLGINTFRILQETLTNITRHASARSVAVSVSETETQLCLEIADNGKGISEENIGNGKTLGILGMKERAALLGGELSIRGIKNKGTKTKLTLPLEK